MDQPVETVSRPIVGHRAWRVDRNGILFATSANGYSWGPGLNVATCWAARFYQGSRKGRVPWKHPHDEPVPGFQCSCGLHIAATVSGLPADWQRYQMVRGVVRAYGRVIEHTGGWRAEKAQIIAIVRGRMVDKLNPVYREIPLVSGPESEDVIQGEKT